MKQSLSKHPVSRRTSSVCVRAYIVIILFSFVSARAYAQTPDTARIVNEVNTQEGSANSDEFVMTKSPTKALLWAIIPSGGQVYTEQYWKVPLFLVPIGALVGLGIYNNSRCMEFADQVRSLTPTTTEYNLALSNRELFRDKRDLSWAIAGGVYLLSFVDAYVGAHLFDFDVGDTLSSIQIYPDIDRNGIGISARW
ncbi:MAG: hypothetical protein J4G05_11595 [Chlorobi bacterium]|nr:hypothetical protein [Chlorobiota bacterium]